MSYPEPRYHDDTGEVSATYRAADHAPEVVYPNGNTVHYLATGAATHGAVRAVPLGDRHRRPAARTRTSTGRWPSRSTS